MEEGSHEKTASTTPFGKYQFSVIAFGLVGAPATFQCLMNSLVGDPSSHVGDYIDKLVIFSGTWEGANLTVNKSKCQFDINDWAIEWVMARYPQLRFTPSKIYPLSDKEDIRSFLRLAGYYRRFVPLYVDITTPLSDLTCKDLPETDIHQSAFELLKQSLSADLILQGPDYCKAAPLMWASLLSSARNQTKMEIVLWPCTRGSSEELRAVEWECLAIVDSVQHLRSTSKESPS